MPLSGLKRAVDIFVNQLVRADRSFNLLPFLWVQAVELISVASSLALRFCHLLSSLSQGPIVLVHPEHGFGL